MKKPDSGGEQIRRPSSIFFFPSGAVGVCDQFGDQMPKYQLASHRDAIAALKADGYDWTQIPDIMGIPNLAALLDPVYYIPDPKRLHPDR